MVLESLLSIGKYVLETSDPIDLMIKDIDPIKGSKSSKKEPVLIRIIFDLDNNNYKIDYKKLEQQVAKEYRWIGSTFSASREPIRRLTFDNLDYLYKKGNTVIENIIKEIEETDKVDSLNELYNILIDIREKFDMEDVKNYVDYHIKEKKFKVELYTICIRRGDKEIDLAKEEYYKTFLINMIKYPKDTHRGVCHICNQNKEVLSDPSFESGSLLKIYNIDKKGFISSIAKEDNYLLKTFAICPDCRFYLIIGTKYIAKNLVLKLGELSAYIIPRLGIYNYNERVIDELGRVIRKVWSYQEIMQIDKEMRDMTDVFSDTYFLNIVFGEREQNKFRVDGFIQEVPVTNISKLDKEINEVANIANKFWNTDMPKWKLTLDQIPRLFPLRSTEKRSLIDLLSSILYLHSYSLDKLIEKGVLLARIYRYKSYKTYNIQKPDDDNDKALAFNIVKFNYLILLLTRLGMIANNTEAINIQLNDDRMLRWFQEMGYSPIQKGLFMMGYLIAEIGYEQFKKGDTKKSILDKLDFKGMKKAKVITLANEVLQYLRNYKILQYNEGYYCTMINLLDKYKADLDKDHNANLFYILSGYAYATYSIISRQGR